MPKRRPACQLAAAITAGPPPQAKDFPDDEEWHHEQENWIAKQPTGVAEVLPNSSYARRMCGGPSDEAVSNHDN